MRQYVQHDDAHGKGALRLHAVTPDQFVVDNVAALGNVPWGAIVDALWIDPIGCGLDVNSVGPQYEQGDVQQEG